MVPEYGLSLSADPTPTEGPVCLAAPAYGFVFVVCGKQVYVRAQCQVLGRNLPVQVGSVACVPTVLSQKSARPQQCVLV